MSLRILEKDEAGCLTASYITTKGGNGSDRVDVIVRIHIRLRHKNWLIIRELEARKDDKHMATNIECIFACWLSA